MPNANKFTINEVDAAFSPLNPTTGIICMMGRTQRGPVGNPGMVITGMPMFKRIYGNYLSGVSDFPLIAETAFKGGAKLRINRAAHYTDITDDTTLDMDKAALNPKISVLTFSAAFVASNVINLTVSGVAISPVTYATSSNNTLGLLATAIELISTVDSATVIPVTGSNLNRSIVIVHNNTAPTVTSIVVTLGASQATGTNTSIGHYVGDGASGAPLFLVAPKYHGADYNNLIFAIETASNGNATYFNVRITHTVDTSILELYENLTITGNPTISNSTYLKKIQDSSELVDITYANLSATTGQQRPTTLSYTFADGSDGGAIVAADYAGDATEKTGVYKFDSVTDSKVLMVPEIDDEDVHTAFEAYVNNRKDMAYIAYQNLTASNPNTWVSHRTSQGLISNYVQLAGGNIEVMDPSTLTKSFISPLGEIAGAIARVHTNANLGPWRSYTNATYGSFISALSVQVDFGSPANYADLNLLANNQICMVVSKNGKIFLTGNFTAQLDNTKLSYMTIRFLNLHLKSILAPICQRFVDDEVPLDIQTFRDIYDAVSPSIDALTKEDKRAIYKNGWRWEGDQNISSISDVQVNNPTDLDNGIYKAKLYYQPINSLREFELTMTLTPTSVSLS